MIKKIKIKDIKAVSIEVNRLLLEIGKNINEFSNPDYIQELLTDFTDKNYEFLRGDFD